MKVGESVVCKKNMGDDPFLLFFKKGEIYKVTEVKKPGVYVIRGRSFGFYFSIIRSWTESDPGCNYFDDYFVSLNECRKLKLKKLYASNL